MSIEQGIIFEPKDEAEAAIGELESIKAELHAWGHNDAEIPRLNELIARVKNGGIAPEAALLEARSMRATKQDYH